MNKRILKKLNKRNGCKNWNDFHNGYLVCTVHTKHSTVRKRCKLAFMTGKDLMEPNKNGRYYSQTFFNTVMNETIPYYESIKEGL